MPLFSVITPVHLWSDNRIKMFKEAAKSLSRQIFQDFEWIVVDDGSTKDFDWTALTEYVPQVKIYHKNHQERVIAYNLAFKHAKGKWFTLLDGDDEYVPGYLSEVLQMIKNNPGYKMFNFGCIYHNSNNTTTQRGPFQPKKRKIGHEMFGGGNIVNGTFVFHRSVYKDLGAYPGDKEGYVRQVNCRKINYGGVRDLFVGSPYDFSAACQLIYPQLRKFFMVNCDDEPKKIVKELGNPWGQDFLLFWKYTRKYHSLPVDKYLYIVKPRTLPEKQS